jgi:phage terminase small subunit
MAGMRRRNWPTPVSLNKDLEVTAPVKKPSAFVARQRRIGRFMRRLKAVAPWIVESDYPTAKAYCELEVLGVEAFTRLMRKGVENDKDEVRPLLDAWRRIRQTQLAYARELGLGPKARAELRASGRPGVPDDVVDVSPAAVKRVLAITGNQDAEKAETE